MSQIYLDVVDSVIMTNSDFHVIPNALSWAQAAREAARRGTMLLLEAKLSLKSRRHVTRSMEGQDRMQRSDSKSLGPTEKQNKFHIRNHGCVFMYQKNKTTVNTLECVTQLTGCRHDGVNGETPAPTIN